MNTFKELGLSKSVVARLAEIGFKQPTNIQAKTIAVVLAGRDLMASAETGSGKTAAYALPIIEQIVQPAEGCAALVLVPTRELALQVRAEFDRFMSPQKWKTAAIYGGCGYGKQITELRKIPPIIIATPGRLLDLIDQRLLNLSAVRSVVLDEADRLMDLGFMPQVRKIVAHLPKVRQTIMFSVTIDQRVERIAQEYLRDPVRVEVKGKSIEPVSIEQKFHHIKDSDKDGLLLELVTQAREGSVLVFTRTRRKAKSVAARLRGANIVAKEIHGDINQSQRERTLEQYRLRQFAVLVATDIAARGLDIPAITHVINYDLPQSAADYVHRIGRTGRAGRAGYSHTFVGHDDAAMLRQIERLVGRAFSDQSSKTASVAGSVARRRFSPRSRRRA